MAETSKISLAAQNRGEAPSSHPSPRTRGEGGASGNAAAFSRCMRIRVVRTEATNVCLQKIRGGEAPKGAHCKDRACEARRAPCDRRARLSAPHRGTRWGKTPTQLQSGAS